MSMKALRPAAPYMASRPPPPLLFLRHRVRLYRTCRALLPLRFLWLAAPMIFQSARLGCLPRSRKNYQFRANYFSGSCLLWTLFFSTASVISDSVSVCEPRPVFTSRVLDSAPVAASSISVNPSTVDPRHTSHVVRPNFDCFLVDSFGGTRPTQTLSTGRRSPARSASALFRGGQSEVRSQAPAPRGAFGRAGAMAVSDDTST